MTIYQFLDNLVMLPVRVIGRTSWGKVLYIERKYFTKCSHLI